MTLPALIQITEAFEFARLPSSALIILSEGFEERSLAWAKSIVPTDRILAAVVFENFPRRVSRLEELLSSVSTAMNGNKNIQIIQYNRSDPADTEQHVSQALLPIIKNCGCLVIDVSVMSRLLIVILINSARSCSVPVYLIYSEPSEYPPTEEQFRSHQVGQSKAASAAIMGAPSFGVRSIMKTPLLSSTVMLDQPIALIGFTSFNEQLLATLLSNVTPERIFLINSISENHSWRGPASKALHDELIRQYVTDNPTATDGMLVRRASSLRYQDTFIELVRIYNSRCYYNRIVIAPTGTKMQAVACALFKICCPDVHIEYPMPESYFVDSYRPSPVRNIYLISMPPLSSLAESLRAEFNLAY